MARILCNVAGGGKPLKGNAKTGDVLAGKTFSNKQSNALTGSMPNNGAWSASTSGSGSVTIPAGYHNGSGTVSGSASYSQGRAATKKLRSFTLHLSVMHNYSQHYDQNVTVTCNYDSDNNFTGFSATSTPPTDGGISGEYHYASIGNAKIE